MARAADQQRPVAVPAAPEAALERGLDRVEVVDEYGRPGRIPAVSVRPEQITWERTQQPPTLHIAFEYTRTVRYPLVDREAEATFEIDQTYDVSRPEWGPR